MSNSSPGQYLAEAEQAGLAAKQAGLGKPGRFFASTRRGFAWRVKDTGQLVYEFEGGLVGVRVGGRPEVFPWARITQVTRFSQHMNKNVKYVCTRFVYKVTRDDGAAMDLRGSYVSPERSKQADPAAVGSRFDSFGQDVARRVSTAKLPEARAALARGESLKFGFVVIRADGIVRKNGVVAWNLIREVSMKNGHLDIFQVDKKITLLAVPVSTVPNLPLLLHLIDELRKGQ
ncbi:DUF6585 family protein [Catenulispora pinisilvae]|uniref:DUF6585 family protein n=1 Tax=Catenulispora pinisilvae TaxID=2705253 RepID=UPI0018926B13|nr:DUF6585 family protein [Catenulispora pinisilvae]